jgi:Polyketide cyclase / dehydrase and lipid transport
VLSVRKERLVATFEHTVMIRRPAAEVFGVPLRSVPSRSEEHLEVTVYHPPRQLELRGQLGPFPSRLSYALDAIPEGTRVTTTVELELRGPGRLLGPVAVPGVRDAVAANLQKLKELLER